MAHLEINGRDPELSERINRELVAYNVEITGVSEMTPLSVKVTGDDGGLIAGLDGVSWGTAMLIDSVWVHPEHRKDGWGTKVMAAAESEARTRGCTDMSVCSFTFQVSDFYKRFGFVETGRRLGYPNGTADVVMWKGLTGGEPVEIVAVVDFENTDGREYADRAVEIVERHGGHVQRRLSGADQRTEVHLVWFPDYGSFAAFRSDPELGIGPVTTRVIPVSES